MGLFCILALIPLLILFGYRVHAKLRGRTGRRSNARLDGKVVVVTGEYFAPGLPYQTVKELLSRGAKVILGLDAREYIGRAVLDVLKDDLGHDVQIEVKTLHLTSLESVRVFCKEILLEESRIDVLIHNPGPVPGRKCRKRVTEDGLESIMTANYFGQFLLTHCLLDLITSTPRSRIITVSSGAHHFARTLDMGNLNSEKTWAPLAVHARAQLARILFTRELHRRLWTHGFHNTTLNAVHPGARKGDWCSDCDKKNMKRRFWNVIQDALFQNVQESEETTIHLAVADEVEGISGVYWVDCQPSPVSNLAQDGELGKRLWETSVRMVGLEPDENIFTSASGEVESCEDIIARNE